MTRWLGHGAMVVMLTALTQLGGLAWLASRWFRRPLLAFVLLYAGVWGAVQVVAPLTGRVALPCRGEVLRMQSPLYCALMRNFVTPDLRALAEDAAARVAKAHPGTVTLALDGSLPFVVGFPLLPHLSHDDGEKLDFALYYRDPEGTYAPGRTRSPLGYLAFESLDAPEDCPEVWLTMRWSLRWVQGLFPPLALDEERTASLARALMDDPRTEKLFLEPPLAAKLGLSDPKLRFQGCRAARHDDHIHVQL